MLGNPETGYVRRRDGKDESPACLDISAGLLSEIIDAGESFLRTTVPHRLYSRLYLFRGRVIFQEDLVALWSMVLYGRRIFSRP